MMKFFLTILLSASLISLTTSQSSFLTTGHNISGSSGSLSFSVGQISYVCFESEQFSISNGVQQAIEVSLSTSVVGYSGLEELFEIFPNPTRNDLNIITENKKEKTYTIQIFDMLGNKVYGTESALSVLNISLEELVPAIYILTITDRSKAFNSYKIVKR